MQDYILNYLPDIARKCFRGFSEKSLADITEFRLRAGRPFCITVNNKIGFLEMGGFSLIPNCRSIIMEPEDLEECFLKLCENSVYSHEKELSQGFISLKGGCRAGVCGMAYRRPEGSLWFREISSINIRIAREIKGLAIGLSSLSGGILFCGAPHTGKTTLLRDYIRICSDRGERVSLIDCRCEIAAAVRGKPSMDVGINTDISSGGEKAMSIENALRALSPDAIAFDEIGSPAELEAISSALRAGARIITTLHAGSLAEIKERNKSLPILETGAFENVVMLNRDFKMKAYKVGDLLDKTNCGGYDNPLLFNFRDDFGGEAFQNCGSASSA